MSLGTLAVNLVARTSVFDRNLKKSRRNLHSFAERAERARHRLIAFGGALLAGGGAVGALRKLVLVASDGEETLSKFNAVFKEFAGTADQWASEFSGRVGRSRQEVQSWMATLQDTFVPLGMARQEAMGMAQSLTQLAVDVASFNNKADADVIRDFTSALVGNHETVRKFGIIITEAALKQEALKQGMAKAYSELTNLEKVQLRYNMILGGTTDAQGDAERTGNSFANQMKRLKANLTNVAETLGKKVLPIMSKTLKRINAFLKGNAEHLANIVSHYAKMFVKIGLAIGVFKMLMGLLRGAVRLYKAVASAAAVANATIGPVGWTKLLIGAAVGATALLAVETAFDRIERSVQSATEETDAFTESVKRAAGAMQWDGPEDTWGSDRYKALIGDIGFFADKFKVAFKEIEKVESAMARLEGPALIARLQEVQSKYAGIISRAKEWLDAGKLTRQEFTNISAKVGEVADRLKKAADHLNNIEFKKIQDKIQVIKGSLGDVLLSPLEKLNAKYDKWEKEIRDAMGGPNRISIKEGKELLRQLGDAYKKEWSGLLEKLWGQKSKNGGEFKDFRKSLVDLSGMARVANSPELRIQQDQFAKLDSIDKGISNLNTNIGAIVAR